MDWVREVERLWNCMSFKPMTCALPCWTIASPLSVSLQLSFHSLLLFVLSLCQKSLWCSPLKFFLSLTRTVPSSLLTCPASLAQSRFCLRLHSACFWKQFSSPPLLIHPCKACWKATLPSVSLHPHGFQKTQRHQWLTYWLSSTKSKAWLNFSLTFRQLSPNQYLCKLDSDNRSGSLILYTPDISKSLTGMFC